MAFAEEVVDVATSLVMALYLITKLGPLSSDQFKLCEHVVMSSCLLIVEAIEDEARRAEELSCRIMITTGAVFKDHYDNSNRKRVRMLSSEYDEYLREGKISRDCRHNHERARECVTQDWIGTNLTFSDRQFERVFRLTRGTVERLIQACGNFQPKYFTTANNCAGKAAISIEVKVLGILKCIAFGCSGSAFMDYHQVAPNTFTEGLTAFFRALKADTALQAHFMRHPNLSRRYQADH
jgi:hypothetical protein